MHIPIKYQRELSALLAEGHRRFGKVMPRRPYHDDDGEGGGAGTPKYLFEQHPLLAEVPIGASSDLTFLTTDNQYSMDEAEKRSDEATLQLQKQLELALSMGHRNVATLNPYAQG
jgi:hypothetical protein